MDKYLAPDENVVYSTFVHWKVYFMPFVFFSGWMVMSYFKAENFIKANQVIEVALISFAVLLFLRAFYYKNTIEFFVTNRRILIKQGFVAIATKGMNLQQIESIDVNQSAIGRIFNYGNLTVNGTGTSKIILTDITGPFKFRKTLITAIQEAR